MRRELLGYQELLEEHEGTLKVYNNKLVELRQDLQQKEIRKAELGVALERLSAEQRQAAERLELLLDDRNQVSQEYMAARQQLTDLRPQLTALEAEDAQGKQLLDESAETNGRRPQRAGIYPQSSAGCQGRTGIDCRTDYDDGRADAAA